MRPLRSLVVLIVQTGLLAGLCLPLSILPCQARSTMTPWSNEGGVANLVYGSSSPLDVQQALGRMPDQTVSSGQMYPVVTNDYYFDEKGSGAATVFVFENGFLVGMHYKSATNHFLDLTYLLINAGDRWLNSPFLQGYRAYYPNFDFFVPDEEAL